MINTAEVMLWGTRIGIIHMNEANGVVAFEYDKDFLKSNIEVSPIHMPLSERVYEFPELARTAFHGAPGLVADSLPDKFGNKIIDRWLAEQGKSISEFNVIDRLCYTGKRGMGALEYIPATSPFDSTIEDVNISKMVEFASDVLSDRKDKLINLKDNAGYSQLVLLGTSAGGARAKALIAVEYTRIEYGYYLMAKAAGVIMNECRLLEDAGYAHFITKRFDRNNNKKIHMQTLGAISHIDYNIPGLCSYEQAAYYMNRLGIPYSDVEQFYRRMVFNVILINQDDHVKNVSFLMDKNGVWRLSPAYDVTFAYDSSNMWLKAHQMLINGKSSDISYGDLIKCGINMGVSKRKCDAIISYIEDVAKRFSDYMEMAGVREKTCQIMNDIIISNNIRKTGD